LRTQFLQGWYVDTQSLKNGVLNGYAGVGFGVGLGIAYGGIGCEAGALIFLLGDSVNISPDSISKLEKESKYEFQNYDT
jgi:hypothetical protein